MIHFDSGYRRGRELCNGGRRLGSGTLGKLSLEALSKELLEQRLVGHIPLVCQDLQLAEHGFR
jgi:hypothetical protein